jgi:hypothetical protein
MGHEREARDRLLQRCAECHRLEEQLLSLAYQQVCPTIRRKTKQHGARSKSASYEPLCISNQARRA